MLPLSRHVWKTIWLMPVKDAYNLLLWCCCNGGVGGTRCLHHCFVSTTLFLGCKALIPSKQERAGGCQCIVVAPQDNQQVMLFQPISREGLRILLMHCRLNLSEQCFWLPEPS